MHSDSPLICAVDVDYRADGAVAAAVAFSDWQDEVPALGITCRIEAVADYEPGRFYVRELPCILAILEKLPARPGSVIVDGHVWVRESEPGLGFHLFEALHREVPIIGVAKSSFDGSPHAVTVLRGKSTRPLYVTAAGMDPAVAAGGIARMHGDYRLPTLLKAVDSLCRS